MGKCYKYNFFYLLLLMNNIMEMIRKDFSFSQPVASKRHKCHGNSGEIERIGKGFSERLRVQIFKTPEDNLGVILFLFPVVYLLKCGKIYVLLRHRDAEALK